MKKVLEDKTTIHEVSWGFSSFFFQYENIFFCLVFNILCQDGICFGCKFPFHQNWSIYFVMRILCGSNFSSNLCDSIFSFCFFHFIVFHFHFSHCVSCILKIDCWRTSVSLIMWFVEKVILHKFTWQLFFFHALAMATDASSDWLYTLDSDSSTFNPQSNVHF